MPPAYVQSDVNAGDASSTSIAATFGSNVGAANRLIIVDIAWDGDGSTNNVQSIADSLSTSFQLADFEPGVADMSAATYYGMTGAGGADTVTVTFSASVPFRAICITEVSDINTSDPLDVAVGATGTSAAPASGAATTSAANAFLHGFVTLFSNTTIAPGTNESFTEREDWGAPNTHSGTEDVVKATAGSTEAQFGLGGSVTWICILTTFNAAAIGLGPVHYDIFATKVTA